MFGYIRFLLDTQINEPMRYRFVNIIRWIHSTWNIRNDFATYKRGDFMNW